MMDIREPSALAERLRAPMAAVIDKHRGEMGPLLLAGKAGELSRSALSNDENVRMVAVYAYAVLPGLVRLAVKEPTFIDFVLAHRETVLEKLVAQK